MSAGGPAETITTNRRDPEDVARALKPWLMGRLGDGTALGALEVAPPSGHGFSNDTLLVDAVVDGEEAHWVVQAAPTGLGLFPEYTIDVMARVQSDLRDHSDVPVANVRWSESDPSVLGAPFYVMDRVDGRVPDESPLPYHAAGWVSAASVEERRHLWASILRALGTLHQIEVGDHFGYLTAGRWGMALDADPGIERVRQWCAYTEWAAEDEPPPPSLVEAWDRLARSAPPRPERLGIGWGDTKLGNIMFDGFDVVALLDWEAVGVGPAEEDLTNLLVVDTVLAAFAQVPRADGFATLDETVKTYQEILGRELIGVPWWYAFGVAKMAAECDRLLRQFRRLGSVPEGVDLEALNIAVPHLAPALDRALAEDLAVPDDALLPKLMAYARGMDRDDDFHVPTTLDHHWTETCWFSLVIPDAKMTIQLYPFFQTNLGVCSAGVYIWDDSGDQWWNCRYYKNFWHLPFPTQPLHGLQLPNGLRYRCLEPQRSYAVGFDCPDGQDVHLDIRWDAVIPVNRAPTGTHLDQPGRITGTLVLDGETIEVDGVGFRDRTWSPRPQTGPTIGPFESMGYTWGTSRTSDDGFFLLSGNLNDECMAYGLLDGLLYRDGGVAKLTEARRTLVARDPQTGCPSGAVIDVVDELGRSAHIEGTNVNHFAVNLYPNLLVWECQTSWSMDGLDLVGEDEDNWGVHPFRTWLRRHRPT